MKKNYEVIDKVNPTIKLNDGTVVEVRIIETRSRNYCLEAPSGERFKINLDETPVYKVKIEYRYYSEERLYLDEKAATTDYKHTVKKFSDFAKEKSKYAKYRCDEHSLFDGSFSRYTEFQIEYKLDYIPSVYISIYLFKFINKK